MSALALNPFTVAVEALRLQERNLRNAARLTADVHDQESAEAKCGQRLADTREALAVFERLAGVEARVTTEHAPEGPDPLAEFETLAETVRFHCWNGRYQEEEVAMAPTCSDDQGWNVYGTSPHDAEVEAVLKTLAALECRRRNGEVG